MNNRIDNAIVLLFCVTMYAVSPGGFFVVLLVSLWYLRAKNTQPPHRYFLIDIMLLAFVLRLAVLAIMSVVYILKGRVLTYAIYPGWTPNVIGDASYYTLRGLWIALHWQGADVSAQVLKAAFNPIYGWTGYTYLVAAFHYVFGFSPISSVLINCCFALMSGFFSYSIAREYLSERISRLTAVLVLFFPSMFLWSITNLKDMSGIVTVLFIIWAYVKQFRAGGRKKVVLFVLMFVGVFLLSMVRKNFGMLMAVSIAVSYIFAIPRPSPFVKLSIIVPVAIILFATGRLNLCKLDRDIHTFMYKLIAVHQATLNTAGSNYKILDDKYYLHNPDFIPSRSPDEEYYLYPTLKMGYMQYVQVYARAMKHFILEPYIWKIDTSLKLLSFVQIVIWYILLPFALIGLIYVLRCFPGPYGILFVYFIVMSFIIAVSQGNVGTLFRLRDIVSPIVLFWSSVGIGRALRWNMTEEGCR